MTADLSVLMSVYNKERPEYLVECFNSLLNQTVQAKEWVVVKDGPLTKELDAVIDEFSKSYSGLIKIVPINVNVGLGLALKEGIINCSYEIIARMDTDDIARKDRFELQLKEFELNQKLDICGGQIVEFDTTIDNVLSKRIVPLKDPDIKVYQKERSAFNHMTVMYKKNSVLRAGNYEHCPLMEDDMLWVNMILSNAVCKNIDEFLVYARTGKAMIQRRGGLGYLKKYYKAKKKIYETGYISYFNFMKSLIVQAIVSLAPPNIRLFIFHNLLRKGDC